MQALIEISSFASTHSIYVVVNLIEKDTTTENATYYYNTNVAFDKAGKVVGRFVSSIVCYLDITKVIESWQRNSKT